ncbi:MlaD family protein [Rhodococcus erythropolis]|uniref:MCE family protein n=1 Tax=Rhodococcus erythropolis TaxID=1833 RepID=UPI001E3F3C41|nr:MULTISPECIES: MlaD family protein [Rhodococcus erythropolis group]MCD2107912.1 MCE family protein [Rhodococcus qingshengii]MCZ4527083.1 MlaD family protein [Rhodococcus erythropolis]
MSTRGFTATSIKLGVFVTVMTLVLAGLVVVFGQFRFGDYTEYRALFTTASGLEPGDLIRVAGVEVGKVTAVEVDVDNQALVIMDVDSVYRVTTGTSALIRYQNLVGDRFLELRDGPGELDSTPEGSIIGLDRTSPAVDLDLLIGSFRPLLKALDPVQLNNLSAELIAVLQGQGGTVQSILAHTASLTSTLAERDAVIGQVVDNLNTVLGTVNHHRDEFAQAIQSAQSLADGLSRDRELWGTALSRIDTSARTVSDLLVDARPPLQGTLTELNRTAAQLDAGKETIDSVTERLPDAYAALSRLGAYGNFFNYYLCGLRLRLTGPDGNPVTTPLIGQTTGRCEIR